MLVPEVIADGPFDCGNHNHLFALEKLVPEGRADSHLTMVAWGHRGARSG